NFSEDRRRSLQRTHRHHPQIRNSPIGIPRPRTSDAPGGRCAGDPLRKTNFTTETRRHRETPFAFWSSQYLCGELSFLSVLCVLGGEWFSPRLAIPASGMLPTSRTPPAIPPAPMHSCRPARSAL